MKIAGTVFPVIVLVILFILHKFNLQKEEFMDSFFASLPWVEIDILLPVLAAISFSYIFLRIIDLIVSVQFNHLKLIDPISMMGYLMPFHMLIAGPINTGNTYSNAFSFNVSGDG